MFRAYRMVARYLAALALVLAALSVSAPAQAAATLVAFNEPFAPGTVVIKTSERRLYLVLGSGRAERYPVGVGKAGKRWTGVKRIVRKMRNPDWAPPPEVKRDIPTIPDFIRGGTPANPLGVAELVMTGNDTAIHGTNRPNSVGGFVSYGCIRMYNADVLRLFAQVQVGTPVVVLP
jgi:lipoprotein-anchoring transpeptidase ErfK/SrfK